MNELPWDKEAEKYQIKWRKESSVLPGQYGNQNRVTKEYILPSNKWLHGTWEDEDLRNLLKHYLESNQIQANQGKHNLKSSWTQCANIFFPFRFHPHMKYMLASFLKRELNLDVSSIDAVELEYAAPGKLAPRHLLGESSGKRGSGQTSPDVAILLSCADGACAIYLIENKYIEHNFYPCSAAKKTISKEHSLQGLKPNPDPGRCRNTKELIRNPAANCHQISWGRKYWSILRDCTDSDTLQNLPYCIAMKDGYQLLRQQALAQGIANIGLFDHVFSGVVYDERNNKLISCLNDLGMTDFTRDWPSLFSSASKVKFHCFSHQELISWVSRSRSTYIQKWSRYVCDRYGYW